MGRYTHQGLRGGSSIFRPHVKWKGLTGIPSVPSAREELNVNCQYSTPVPSVNTPPLGA